MGAHPKSWNDQPSEVLGCEVLASFAISVADPASCSGSKMVNVEIRRVDYETHRLVTAGNLFASQTVQCDGDREVYALLNALSKGIDKLPKGCDLVE